MAQAFGGSACKAECWKSWKSPWQQFMLKKKINKQHGTPQHLKQREIEKKKKR